MTRIMRQKTHSVNTVLQELVSSRRQLTICNLRNRLLQILFRFLKSQCMNPQKLPLGALSPKISSALYLIFCISNCKPEPLWGRRVVIIRSVLLHPTVRHMAVLATETSVSLIYLWDDWEFLYGCHHNNFDDNQRVLLNYGLRIQAILYLKQSSLGRVCFLNSQWRGAFGDNVILPYGST